MEFTVAIPAELVFVTEDEREIAGRTPGADPAWLLVNPCGRFGRVGRAHEVGLRGFAVALARTPLHQMSPTQIAMASLGSLAAGDQAIPPVHGVIRRNRDDLGPKHRVERGRADQRGEDLEPIPTFAIALDRERRRCSHHASPQAVRSALSNSGSCTST